MTQARKVGIIGLGHVGPHVANSLLLQGLVDELYLCDIDAKKCRAEWQDLHDSLSFCPYNAHVFDCGDRYEELAGCDVIVNAAGKVTLCAENRDGELFFGTDAVRTWANRVVDAGFKGIFVTISNPCDVIATEIWHLTGYDPKRIIGSGTGLDSSRLRAQISFACGDLDPKSINAYMIGEHGASMIAAWKSASISGKLLSELAQEYPERFAFDKTQVEKLGREGGYVAYEGKQCTEYAVANSAVRVIAAVSTTSTASWQRPRSWKGNTAKRASSPRCRASSAARALSKCWNSISPVRNWAASTPAASTFARTSRV